VTYSRVFRNSKEYLVATAKIKLIRSCRGGQAHAEVMALNNYDGSTENVVAYVTLEPCSFVGRTPSCALALIDAGVAKVVVAIEDPDPRNSGKGIELLRANGVEVVVGVFANEVSAFISAYLGHS